MPVPATSPLRLVTASHPAVPAERPRLRAVPDATDVTAFDLEELDLEGAEVAFAEIYRAYLLYFGPTDASQRLEDLRLEFSLGFTPLDDLLEQNRALIDGLSQGMGNQLTAGSKCNPLMTPGSTFLSAPRSTGRRDELEPLIA